VIPDVAKESKDFVFKGWIFLDVSRLERPESLTSPVQKPQISGFDLL
jgi:hypothetical protein